MYSDKNFQIKEGSVVSQTIEICSVIRAGVGVWLGLITWTRAVSALAGGEVGCQMKVRWGEGRKDRLHSLGAHAVLFTCFGIILNTR